MVVAGICFQWPKRGRNVGETGDRVAKVAKMSTLKPHTDEAETMFLTGLKGIAPSAVLFSLLVPLEQACTSASQVVRKLSLLLTSLQKQIYLVMGAMQHVRMFSPTRSL